MTQPEPPPKPCHCPRSLTANCCTYYDHETHECRSPSFPKNPTTTNIGQWFRQLTLPQQKKVLLICRSVDADQLQPPQPNPECNIPKVTIHHQGNDLDSQIKTT